MEMQNPQIRRLILWNRFWLTLVTLAALVGGFKYLEHRLIKDSMRLFFTSHVRPEDGRTGKSERVLIFSTNQGGPFIVTHLAYGADFVAELPQPRFIPGPKGIAYADTDWSTIYESELDKLSWHNCYSGEKVRPPKINEPVRALYYALDQVNAVHSAS